MSEVGSKTNKEVSSSKRKTRKEQLYAAAEMIKRYNQKESVDE
mgnify:CR=1 FL=1